MPPAPGAGSVGPAATAPLAVSVAFARRLRRAGLDVPVHASSTFAQSLGLLGMTDRAAVYWAGRASLVHRPVDLGPYDIEFARFWDGAIAANDEHPPAQPASMGLDDDDAGGEGSPGPGDDQPDVAVRFSTVEVLRHKDFARCTDAELAELHRAVARLRMAGPTRRSRRRRPSRRTHGRPDLRRTLRSAMRTGGEPIHRAWTGPTERPRRLVLLIDVSASMEPYARALVRFAHAAAAGRRGVEVFAVGTRLTRLTRILAGHDPDRALAAASAEVADWSGGTRLGAGLHAYNDRWGARGPGRGAVVLVLSDGWDRGDPDQLAAEMARLARAAHQIIWVNPLAGSPGYAPTAGGMAAALPHVDRLVPGHTLASLEALTELVASWDRPVAATPPDRYRPAIDRPRAEDPPWN